MKSLRHNTKQPSNQVTSIDLDVTPIMNMFVILIPFLVSMAVFTHYSVLEFSLPPNAGVGNGGPSKQDLKLTVVMHQNGYDLTVGDSLYSQVPVIPAQAGTEGEAELEGAKRRRIQADYNYEQLENSITDIRESLTRKNEVVVSVNDGIIFDKVVQVMDVCRKTGFEKVALAEGPNTSGQDS